MGKVLAILGGLIAMAGGVYLVIDVWREQFIDLVFGCIPPVLFFGGLIALIAGISGIKDAARTKKLEKETKEEVKEEVKEEAAAEEEKKEEETKE
jgi:Na+/H+-dicarboxylate symporter